MLFKSVKSAVTHQQRSVRISHLLPILALFTIAGHGSADAQTTGVVVQVVKTVPRPTFYFTFPSSACGFSTLLLTWGSSTTKDGVVVKNELYKYDFTDISTTNSVVTPDAVNDIFAPSYSGTPTVSPRPCQLSFIRAWDTGDTKSDVPLKQGVPNTFQWEALVGGQKLSGSFSSTLTFVAP
ncbi:hypothetical protein [Nostoc sp.]|uniref:hypothetical protein n=1 Tax=Nostoc sp. TaxID=1180 RepID=UPI002FF987C8